MSVHRKISVALALFYCVVFSESGCSAQQSNQFFQIQENLVSDSLIELPLTDCWAIIVLSKDQCSHCTSGMPKLAQRLEKEGRQVIIARVVDCDLLTCKSTEMELREVLDTNLVFKYIPKKRVHILENRDSLKSFTFKTTPFVLYNSGSDVITIESNRVTDDYGRLQSALSKRSYRCGKE